MSNQRPRDERGWRIPYPGTKSWEIYHLLVAGFRNCEIAALYQESNAINVMASHIKHPEAQNKRESQRYKNDPSRHKAAVARSVSRGKRSGGGSYSLYVKKLVRSLDISFTEAVELERKELEKAAK